jgi:hypothetical protein
LSSDEFGRYVVAQKTLSQNEMIFSEVPFAFVPVHNYEIKKYFNTDCENCALVNVWPFLCLECRHATYCSSKCREIHKSIHKYECEGYKKNLFFEIGIAHLSLRVFLVGFEALISKMETMELSQFQKDPDKIFREILKVSKDESSNYFRNCENNKQFFDYARVLCLVPNLFRGNNYPTRNMPYAYVRKFLI